MAHLTKYERETIINFNEGEDTMSVYTHNKALRRKLEQLAQEQPTECRLYKVTHWGEAVEYYIPKSWLKVRPPRRLSERQLEHNRRALKKANLARFSSQAGDVGEVPAVRMGRDNTQDLDGKKGRWTV